MFRLPALLVAVVGAFSVATSSTAAEYVVDLSPDMATMRYLVSPKSPGVPGCDPDDFLCDFGLKLKMSVEFGEDLLAHATVTEFELFGNEAAFADHPEHLAFVKESALAVLTDSTFQVELGPQRDRTLMTAQFSGPHPLELEFFRGEIVRMSGGPDNTPSDGQGYDFGYPVPEPSSFALGAMTLLAGGGCLLRRGVRHVAR